MRKIRIIIVDDHKIFRDGIKLILSNEINLEIVGEANNGQEFLDEIKNTDADIILMDIDMPVMNGIEATKKALEFKPDLKIIALSMFGDEEFYYKMIHAGVKGFLLKESKSEELKKAIEDISSGENYFSQGLLRKIIFNYGGEKLRRNSKTITLTPNETEVLKLICNGYSNSEIADELNLSQQTAEGHRANLLKKTESKNTANLIMYAIKNKLIEI